jgi:hypothetical protein
MDEGHAFLEFIRDLREGKFFIDNLLVQVHFIIVMLNPGQDEDAMRAFLEENGAPKILHPEPQITKPKTKPKPWSLNLILNPQPSTPTTLIKP